MLFPPLGKGMFPFIYKLIIIIKYITEPDFLNALFEANAIHFSALPPPMALAVVHDRKSTLMNS
jgi:hypothetical protein